MKRSAKFLVGLCLFLILGTLAWQKWGPGAFSPSPEQSSVEANSSILPGSYYEVAIPPRKIDTYLSAEYRIWIPNGVREIRGLIVKQHGCGDPAAASGLNQANDLQWQALASKHQFALLSSHLPTGDKPCEYWALINYGSGQAFLRALHAFAARSQHPEIEKVPWAFWGHSGGADWASQMLQEYPERTIAVVGVRGGGFPMLGTNRELAAIPVLFASGANDPYAPETLDLPKRVFLRYRRLNAPWGFAIEANVGHECGDTRLLAIPYLDTVLSRRLKPSGNELLPIDIKQGWLGNPIKQTVARANEYKGTVRDAVWLPDEEVARKWQQYLRTGKPLPTGKPLAPSKVEIVETEPNKILLRWKYTPDLENGLPSFHIYRNNALIGTFQGQKYNSSDAPVPSNIKLEFQSTGERQNSVYIVSAFNTLGETASQPSRSFKKRQFATTKTARMTRQV
jgi:hypothetical protein